MGRLGVSVAVSQSDSFGPDKAVEKFLSAVRSGNEEQAAAMLTPITRQKTSEMNMNLPAASETAKFKVGEVEMVAEDGAHVAWSGPMLTTKASRTLTKLCGSCQRTRRLARGRHGRQGLRRRTTDHLELRKESEDMVREQESWPKPK